MSNPSIKKSILITGASSGIGKALAETYANHNIHLALTGRNIDRLNQVAETCRRLGAQVSPKIVDVTNQEKMAQWLEEIDQKYPLDICIANAGISAGTEESGEDDAQVRRIFNTNLYGVFNTIHPVIERMKKRKKGKIVLISSLAAFRGMPSAPAYCASKAAVKVYGESLRGYLKPYHIDVCVVCPGFVRSHITDQNKFKMPFFMEAERAAKIIIKGIKKNKGRIAFPLPMIFAVWFLSSLPDFIAEKITARAPKK